MYFRFNSKGGGGDSMVKLGPKKGLTPNKLYTVFYREHCFYHNIVVMFKIFVKNIV